MNEEFWEIWNEILSGFQFKFIVHVHQQYWNIWVLGENWVENLIDYQIFWEMIGIDSIF